MTDDIPIERSRLLAAAFEEIYRKGFCLTSMSDIAARAEACERELRRHFPTKRALGLALIDEVIEPMIDELMIRPVDHANASLASLGRVLHLLQEKARAGAFPCGCPLNNLAQEMSLLDAAFREQIERIYERWRGALARTLEREKDQGKVLPTVDPTAAATFLVAAIEGSMGITKTSRSADMLTSCCHALIDYLNAAVRAPHAEPVSMP
ncbi:MAG: TetR family transcriptional regulator C-terminal domain-containing protein [Geminicoccaceae bacterium]|nr:TetR family transcriptional regulator C-terminal domain-containing protein [Geminicoccaceae bacterium]